MEWHSRFTTMRNPLSSPRKYYTGCLNKSSDDYNVVFDPCGIIS